MLNSFLDGKFILQHSCDMSQESLHFPHIQWKLIKIIRNTPLKTMSSGDRLMNERMNERQNGMITRSSVLQLEVLIRKLPAVDGLPSSSIVVSEISTLKTHVTVNGTATACQTTKREKETYLAHELGDHPVEGWPLVAKALFPCAQRSEVL